MIPVSILGNLCLPESNETQIDKENLLGPREPAVTEAERLQTSQAEEPAAPSVNVSRNPSFKNSLKSKLSKSPAHTPKTPKKSSLKRSFKAAAGLKPKVKYQPADTNSPGMSSLPPSMVPVEPDDSSVSERRPPLPLPRFVLNPSRLVDQISDPHKKGICCGLSIFGYFRLC